jgi:hypothetical protein
MQSHHRTLKGREMVILAIRSSHSGDHDLSWDVTPYSLVHTYVVIFWKNLLTPSSRWKSENKAAHFSKILVFIQQVTKYHMLENGKL